MRFILSNQNYPEKLQTILVLNLTLYLALSIRMNYALKILRLPNQK